MSMASDPQNLINITNLDNVKVDTINNPNKNKNGKKYSKKIVSKRTTRRTKKDGKSTSTSSFEIKKKYIYRKPKSTTESTSQSNNIIKISPNIQEKVIPNIQEKVIPNIQEKVIPENQYKIKNLPNGDIIINLDGVLNQKNDKKHHHRKHHHKKHHHKKPSKSTKSSTSSYNYNKQRKHRPYIKRDYRYHK